MSRTPNFISPTLLLVWVRATLRLSSSDLTDGWLNLFQWCWSMLTGGTPFTIEVRQTGQRFKVISADDVWAVNEVIICNEYQCDQVYAPPDATIIDVGAHIGAFSVWAAARSPQSCIYAYEPFLPSYALLRENLALNSVNNVSAFPYAVWGRSTTLFMNTRLPLPSMYSTSEIDSRRSSSVPVEAVSLDMIFEANHLTCCDILKLDCEGGEFEVLLNASPATLRCVRLIVAEYHDNRGTGLHVDLVSLLTQNGFEIEVRPNPALKGVGYLFASNAFASGDII